MIWRSFLKLVLQPTALAVKSDKDLLQNSTNRPACQEPFGTEKSTPDAEKKRHSRQGKIANFGRIKIAKHRLQFENAFKLDVQPASGEKRHGE